MRQRLIAAWALVAALFVAMSVGAHLPAREPPLPPGARIPTASQLVLPDPTCADAPQFAAQSAC
jgi:hypothetical protein